MWIIHLEREECTCSCLLIWRYVIQFFFFFFSLFLGFYIHNIHDIMTNGEHFYVQSKPINILRKNAEEFVIWMMKITRNANEKYKNKNFITNSSWNASLKVWIMIISIDQWIHQQNKQTKRFTPFHGCCCCSFFVRFFFIIARHMLIRSIHFRL